MLQKIQVFCQKPGFPHLMPVEPSKIINTDLHLQKTTYTTHLQYSMQPQCDYWVYTSNQTPEQEVQIRYRTKTGMYAMTRHVQAFAPILPYAIVKNQKAIGVYFEVLSRTYNNIQIVERFVLDFLPPSPFQYRTTPNQASRPNQVQQTPKTPQAPRLLPRKTKKSVSIRDPDRQQIVDAPDTQESVDETNAPDTQQIVDEIWTSLQNKNAECCMCLNAFVHISDVVICSPCRHVLCKQCAHALLDENAEATCPMCRNQIEDVIELSTNTDKMQDFWRKAREEKRPIVFGMPMLKRYKVEVSGVNKYFLSLT